MKGKKLFAILLVIAMMFSMSVTALADNSNGESYDDGSITIKNPQDGVTYQAYKIFDVTYDLGTDGKPGTSDDKYAYTIAKGWTDDVIAYTGATADANGVYTGKGLILTPVKNAAGTVTAYNVTMVQDDPTTTTVNEATFSAADFGAAMAAKTSTKTTTNSDIASFATKDGKLVADELDLGYWMVQPSSANALVSLTTTDADVTISDKNEKPAVDKKIVGEDPLKVLKCTKLTEGSTDYDANHTHDDTCYEEVEKEYTTKSVGDKVPFELDTKVPDMTGYKTYFFVVNDTLTKGLTFNEDVTVKIGGVNQTQKTLTAGTDYSVKTVVNEDGSTNVRIVFKDMIKYWSDDAANDWEGEPIVITYSATVDEDAVMGTDGNTNTAHIDYSNDPNFDPQYDPADPPTDPDDPQDPKYNHNKPGYTGDDPTGEGPSDTVEIYSAELDLTKVDGADGTTPLTGAKFKIEGENLNVAIVSETIFEESTDGTYYRLKDGTYTEDKPVGEGTTPVTTYEETTAPSPVVAYEELTGTQALANEGLYYSTDGGDTKILITAANKADVPGDAKIYQPTYNAVGLYYKDGDNYEMITEENAAEHTAETKYYKAVNHKQSDLYEDTSVKYKKIEVITKDYDGTTTTYEAEGFVDSNGKISFGGLAEGTYYITELVAPDGYNLLKDPIKVEIELVESATAGKYEFKVTLNDDEESIAENGGVISFPVANNKGVELPETGGIGTTIFYIAGGVLLIGAAILLITKKRMNAND